MPNTTYFMSAWVTSSPIDPAALQFYVNQNPVGNIFNSSGGGCSWEQFSPSWNSGAAVTADLCIVTQNSGNGLFGDDYALDDIYFGAACTETDMVNVDVVSVEAQAPATAFLLCNSLPGGIQLDGSGSTSGPNISYHWTTSGGNIVSGANTAIATVNAEGTYTLTMPSDSNAPLISLDGAPLSRADQVQQISASITGTGPFDLNWSTTDGLSYADCLEPLAGPAYDTEYILTITISGGCVALAYTTVLVDRGPAYYVPNAFSPNDDGFNDELLVFRWPGLVKEVESFRVFDRWGGLVFENYNFPPATAGHGWDGRKDGRRMHPGVYVWMAELRLVDDSTVLLKREVVLVR
ncbi:MAG: hypothetical protein KatS3mg031_3088 [Chitinophagales bacterium]|nr:MAG: hypothetical protein KatS3mg031_3088 [Chitinophagales bacterium]